MPRGILATCTARLARGRGRCPPTQWPPTRAPCSRHAYAGEPFIRVLPDGQWPSTAATLGGNAVHLQAAADAHAGRAVVVAAEDNLVKGAAGQAIQIANLMLGLPEAAGLAVEWSRPMSVTAPLGFRAAGVAAGLKASGERDVAVVLNDGPSRRRGRRVHQQPGQGRPGAVDAAGAARRPGPGRRAQLRRRERLHRAARLPGHPRHRRTAGPGPRRRSLARPPSPPARSRSARPA